MFHSHGSVFRSTSVGFCPESQRAPLLSRKCRCHNMRPRHSQRLQSDLGPASRRPPPRGPPKRVFGSKVCDLLLRCCERDLAAGTTPLYLNRVSGVGKISSSSFWSSVHQSALHWLPAVATPTARAGTSATDTVLKCSGKLTSHKHARKMRTICSNSRTENACLASPVH